MTAAVRSLLRERGARESSKVSMVELFFDLVFVFAITQISHTLLAHLDVEGAAQAALLVLAVWWVWVYTTWVTNWLDPERIPVRACLFVLMLAGLVLAAALPQAFGERGPVFASAYVAMQVGRTLFFLWAVRHSPLPRRRNFQRILVWMLVSGVFWLCGGLAEDETRFALWLVAIAIEFIAPSLYFRVPGLGRSTTADWDVDGHHMAERCALFIIIALGESLLVTGATFAGLAWTSATIAAFAIAFVGSIAMWWLYFDTGAERATHHFAKSQDPGRLARAAYTYLHLPIVAGVILCAVSDEILMVHPGHLETSGAWIIIGGPALFLVGNALFKWVTNDRRLPPLSHLAGLAMLALLMIPAASGIVSALAAGALATAALMIVATWESIAIRRGRPSMAASH